MRPVGATNLVVGRSLSLGREHRPGDRLMTDQEYKYQCGVRYLIQLRRLHGKTWFIDYIYHPSRASKIEPMLADVWAQWMAGNMGAPGEWYD